MHYIKINCNLLLLEESSWLLDLPCFSIVSTFSIFHLLEVKFVKNSYVKNERDFHSEFRRICHSHIFRLRWPSCGMNSSDAKGFHVAYPVLINSVLVRSDGHSFTSRKLSVCRIELEVNCKTCTQDTGDTLWEPLKTGKLKGNDKKNHRLPRSKSN